MYIINNVIGGQNLDNIELKTKYCRGPSTIREMIDKRKQAVDILLRTVPVPDFEKEAGLRETPERVAKMYEELFAGYEMDVCRILSKQFPVEGAPTEIWVKDISFYSTCEHHLMPFFGTVDVMYMPQAGGKVVGLSKIARLVEAYARRLQIQERMGNQIKWAILHYLNAAKVEVRIRATHTCMSARGVGKIGAITETVATGKGTPPKAPVGESIKDIKKEIAEGESVDKMYRNLGITPERAKQVLEIFLPKTTEGEKNEQS